MLTELLLHQAARAALADYLTTQQRPYLFPSLDWVMLCNGDVCSIDLGLVQKLTDQFGAEKIFELIGRKKPLFLAGRKIA